MATSYTEEEMVQIMQGLHIAPVSGKVDGREAAKILTWRAKHEYQVNYVYNATAIRQHVKVGHIAEEDIDTTNPRKSLYSYPAVFRLPLAPRRGAGRRKAHENQSMPETML